MYAGVVRYKIKKGKMEEAIGCWRDNVLPEASKQQGFVDANLFINRDESHAFDIGRWASREDCENYEVLGLFQLVFDQMREYLVEPPQREIYEIFDGKSE